MKKKNNKNNKNKKRGILLLSTIFFLILILTFAQILVSNRLSTSGTRLAETKLEIENAREENQLLKGELSKAFSITDVAQRASHSGFIKDSSPIVFGPGQNFASR